MVWAEIPFISVMNPAPGAHENCRSQMKELIVQNYNHPSICFWGISNEITIGGERPGLLDNLRDLNALAHEMDKTRMDHHRPRFHGTDGERYAPYHRRAQL